MVQGECRWCRLCAWLLVCMETFSAVGTSGPTFFLAIAMFGFVFQISSLITEKELKLRQVFSFSDALVFEGNFFFNN